MKRTLRKLAYICDYRSYTMPYRNAIYLFIYSTGIDEFLHTKIYNIFLLSRKIVREWLVIVYIITIILVLIYIANNFVNTAKIVIGFGTDTLNLCTKKNQLDAKLEVFWHLSQCH